MNGGVFDSLDWIKMDFSKITIYDGENWEVKLHHNQNSLGKCVLWFKGESKDFADLSLDEQKEFWELLKKTKDILVDLFNPGMFNYACLGNATKHLHFHVMPRYKDSRTFEGMEFVDEAFGSFPLGADNLLSEEELVKIVEMIKEKF